MCNFWPRHPLKHRDSEVEVPFHVSEKSQSSTKELEHTDCILFKKQLGNILRDLQDSRNAACTQNTDFGVRSQNLLGLAVLNLNSLFTVLAV